MVIYGKRQFARLINTGITDFVLADYCHTHIYVAM
jgi:hypothetical protein